MKDQTTQDQAIQAYWLWQELEANCRKAHKKTPKVKEYMNLLDMVKNHEVVFIKGLSMVAWRKQEAFDHFQTRKA